ncbi:MAG: hypothetical protein OXD34_09015 [bacterium]|nr:hypothetical protein [bacterium]
MLRPVIMIGCGGSGSKAVRYVRDAVARKLRHAGFSDPVPDAWSFIGLDTLVDQEAPGEIPTLPKADFLTVSLGLGRYSAVHDGLMVRYPPDSSTYPYLVGWRPSPDEVAVPLLAGAGQFRAVGRIVGLLASRDELLDRINKAFMDARAGGPELGRVSEALGLPSTLGGATPPIVVICASVAGGTGAGIALDVVEMVRRADGLGGFPVLVLFTADIFDFGMNRSMAANSLGLLSEVMASYWGKQADPIVPSVVPQPGSGPHALFVVGRNSIEGGDLGDTVSVYRAVGEAMSTWVTEPKVQEKIQNFITVNWQAAATDNSGGYPFGEEYQRGAVSSFGAATVTLGRDRFERWATDLFARETLQALARGHLRQEFLIGEGEDLPEPDLIKVLAEKRARTVYEGRGAGLAGATNHFASDDAVRQERRTILAELRKGFPEQLSGSGEEWRAWLGSQVSAKRPEWSDRAEDLDVGEWGAGMVRATCEAASAVAAETSFPVAERATRLAIRTCEREVQQLRKRSLEDRERAGNDYERARSQLSEQPGKLSLEDAPIVEAFEYTARALAFEWRRIRRSSVADILEHAAHQVLAPAAKALQAAGSQAAEALEAKTVGSWPTDGGGIPKAYLRSTVEFSLEASSTWVPRLDSLCKEALHGDQFQAKPVDAVRSLIVAGSEDLLAPLLAPVGSAKRWKPGTVAPLSCEAGADDIKQRVQKWITAPGSRLDRFLREGLGDYLKEEDPVTGALNVDHVDRMKAFRLSLERAVVHSKPLLQINKGLYAMVHTGKPEIDMLCSPFPFRKGHPAEEVAREVVGEDNYRSRDSDASSVLVSSYIKSPVHPAVVRSLTGPIAREVAACKSNVGLFRAAFWLWRRARALEGFVPLHSEMLDSMIRGFAVGRLCGYVTADPDDPRISSPSGPCPFPQPLLTKVSPNDILAALLENFSLCFAEVEARKLEAFEPYRLLHELGASGSTAHDELRNFLETGRLIREQVDSPKAAGPDRASRTGAAIAYLDRNIERFDRLASGPFDGSEFRGDKGKAKKDVPTMEIAERSAECYRQIRQAVDTAGLDEVV